MDSNTQGNIEGVEQAPRKLTLPSLEGAGPATLLEIYHDARAFSEMLTDARERSAARLYGDEKIDARQPGNSSAGIVEKQKSAAEVLERFGITYPDIIDDMDEPVNLPLYEGAIYRFQKELEAAMKIAGVAVNTADSVNDVMNPSGGGASYRDDLEFNGDGTTNVNWPKE